MKLIIQIPCYNEEKTLPMVLSEIPSEIPGIDTIETQIIDDGSTDKTLEVAKQFGVNHILIMGKNKGLATAFKAGVDNAINLGADFLVNTDGDNQYKGRDIEKIVIRGLNEKADLVIGCRPIRSHPEFSFLKKILQTLGSWILRKISNTDIKDAASGFRLYSRNALLHLNIYSDFSYCLETLIQLGVKNMKIVGEDIDINPKERDSRLFRSTWQYLWCQGKTMVNIFLLYKSNLLFGSISFITSLFSVSLLIRYYILISYFSAPQGDFWPTIILSGILLMMSVLIYISGVVASLIGANRRLLEEILYRSRLKQLNEYEN